MKISSYDILVNKENLLDDSYVPNDLVLLPIPFAPDSLTKPDANSINDSVLNGQLGKFFLRKKASDAVYCLFQRASENGIYLYGVSGYCSYKRQEEIYQSSMEKMGWEHTDEYTTIPGCSEHQTGLALDISVPSLHFELTKEFSKTKEAHWLFQYASLFGFIIRYPKDTEVITGFAYEPWHIRYVTKPLAFYLSKTRLTLEQYHMLSLKH